MKKIGVVGTKELASLLAKVLEYFGNEYQIAGFACIEEPDFDMCRFHEIAGMSDMEFLVIASEKEDYFLYGDMAKATDIGQRESKVKFLHPYLKYIHHFHLFDFERLFLDRENYANSIDYLEFHVTDNCNLNCKGCAHFSNIVSGKKNTDFKSWENDMLRLKELAEDIYTIRIMGGEPFLNLELGKFAARTREIFPRSMIHIVSNGTLLHKAERETIRSIRENGIIVDISYYPETDRERVAGFFEGEGLKYRISTVPTTEFLKWMNPDGDTDADTSYEKCGFKTCHFLHEGRLCACAFPLLVKYYNEYFQENIEAHGGIDIYSSHLQKGMLRGLLSKPLDACRYCAVEKELVPWEGHRFSADKSDWHAFR